MKRIYTAKPITWLHFLIATTIISNSVFAANYYWVGSTGDWTDYANHWATTDGGNTFHTSVPTATDDVYFTALSFTGTNNVVTLNDTAYCHDLIITGIASQQKMTSFTINNNLNIDGSVSLHSNFKFDFNFAGFEFTSSATGNLVTTNNAILPDRIIFNGTGEWTIVGGNNVVGTNVYFNSGTLNINCNQLFLYAFYSTTSNARTLDLGNSYISSYYWTINNGNNNFNLIPGQSLLESSHFNGGNLTYANFSIDDLGVADVGGSNTFDTLFVSNYSQVNFEAGKTQTANAFVQNYPSSCYYRVMLTGTDGVASINVPSGNVTFDDIIIQNLTVTGGATFNANNSYALGNTTGWNITNGPMNRDLYWVGDASSWADGAHWSLTSGGAPINCVPGPYDNVHFDQNSFTTTGQGVFVDVPAYCKTMDWSQALYSPEISGYEYDINITGSLILNSNMYSTFIPNLNFLSDSTGNIIDMAGIDHLGGVKFNGKGDWTLANDLTNFYNGGFFALLQGSINANGKAINFYAGEFQTAGDSSKYLNINNCNVSFSSWNAQSIFNLLDSNATITMTTGGNFIGKQMHYNHVEFAGTYGYNIYNNNTFDTLSLTPTGTYSFYISNTQNIGILDFTSTPSSGQEVTIGSMTPGTQTNINLTGGNFCGDYLIVQDIASVGNHFFAGPNSTDNGNNTNVYFMNCTPPLTINITDSMNLLCYGDSTGWAKFSVSGGLAPYSYSWSNGAVVDSTNGLSAGTYTVYVWDSLNDTVSASITITEPSAVVFNFDIGVDTICSTQGSINLSATPTGGTFSGNGVVGTTFDPSLLSNFGITYVTYTVVDTNGCSQSTTDSIFVDVCTDVVTHIKQVITVKPNPTTNTTTFTSNSLNAEPIVISNIVGEAVYSGTIQGLTIVDVSYLPNGIYTVKVGTGNNTGYSKLIKN